MYRQNNSNLKFLNSMHFLLKKVGGDDNIDYPTPLIDTHVARPRSTGYDFTNKQFTAEMIDKILSLPMKSEDRKYLYWKPLLFHNIYLFCWNSIYLNWHINTIAVDQYHNRPVKLLSEAQNF